MRRPFACCSGTAARSWSHPASAVAARCRCTWARSAQGKALARGNVAAWSAELARGLDAVVVNASGCGTTVKDYGHFVGGEAQAKQYRRARARRHRTFARAWAQARRCRALSGRLSRCLLAPARPARDQRAATASGARGLRRARHTRAAFLLRLGRHLQPAAARDRKRRSASAKPRISQASIRTSSRPAILAAWCRSDASCECRSCTPSNCWIGRPAARHRRHWRDKRLRDPAPRGPQAAEDEATERTCRRRSKSHRHLVTRHGAQSIRGASMTSAKSRSVFLRHHRRARRRWRQSLRRDDPALRREHDAGRRSAASRRRLPGLDRRRTTDRARGEHAQGGALSDQHRQQYRARLALGVQLPDRSWSISAAE